MYRPVRGNFAFQTRGDFGEIGFARVFKVGALLQVARILGRFSVDQARMRRGHDVGRRAAGDEIFEQMFHRLGVFVEFGHVARDARGLFDFKWFVV